MSKTLARRSAALATLVLLCAAGGGQVRAEGLLEFLFGVRPEAPAQQEYEPAEPLEMTVSPRRERSRPKEVSRPVRLATPIDPKTTPNWHLVDPTLRPGDIVVLPGQVLVFEGGAFPAQRSDFATLDRSRRISKGERQQIEKMATVPGSSGDTRGADASRAVYAAHAGRSGDASAQLVE